MSNKSTISIPSAGKQGNPFALLGECRRAMKAAGWGRLEIERFIEKATSGDFEHMLRVVDQYCEDVEK